MKMRERQNKVREVPKRRRNRSVFSAALFTVLLPEHLGLIISEITSRHEILTSLVLLTQFDIKQTSVLISNGKIGLQGNGLR